MQDLVMDGRRTYEHRHARVDEALDFPLLRLPTFLRVVEDNPHFEASRVLRYEDVSQGG